MEYMHSGKILKIDLTSGKVSSEPTFPYVEKFVGGRGIDAKILYDTLAPGTDPLGPGNAVVFSTGPFTGTLVPGSGRTHVVTKSPVTGFMGASSMGGTWSPELKYAGWDHLVVTGKADKPVYIWIENDDVQIRDAAAVWGKDTYETQGLIQEELNDPDAQVICIGPAGEKQIFSSMVTSRVCDTMGKQGVGAVFGSKNLKAIAVRGTKAVKLHDAGKFVELAGALHEELRGDPFVQEMSDIGLTDDMEAYGEEGMAGVNNWQTTDYKRVDYRQYFLDNAAGRVGCFGCPIGCKQNFSVDGIGKSAAKCITYVNAAACMGNFDKDIWFETVLLCQTQGLDVTQVAGTIAWMMELYQRGIITTEDTGGLALDWGSRDAILGMVNKILNREGIGDILAGHYKDAVAHFGEESEEYFFHLKGNTVELADIRPLKNAALSGAAAGFGKFVGAMSGFEQMGFVLTPERVGEEVAAHYKGELRAWAEAVTGTPEAAEIGDVYDGKAALTKYSDDETVVTDIMGYCKWHGAQACGPHLTDRAAAIYEAGKGAELPLDKLMEAIQRTRLVERAFDIREGLTRAQDVLPKRFYEEMPEGQFKGVSIDWDKFEGMKSEYYQLRGWDAQTGIPTEESLKALGLDDVAGDMAEYAKKASVNPVQEPGNA